MNSYTPESELCHQMALGNKLAYQAIYDRYWQKVYQVAIVYLKESKLGAKVVENVFRRLWAERENMPVIENLDAHIFMMMRSEVKRALARKQFPIPPEDQLLPHTPQSCSLQQQIMVVAEYAQQIDQIIEQLPQQQKRILLLGHKDGLSYTKIAKELNITEDLVKQVLARSVMFVRRKLLAEHGEELLFCWIIAGLFPRILHIIYFLGKGY